MSGIIKRLSFFLDTKKKKKIGEIKRYKQLLQNTSDFIYFFKSKIKNKN